MSTQPAQPPRGFDETLTKLSRGQTIAMIVVTIAALAGAGALAGALMSGADSEPTTVIPNDNGDLAPEEPGRRRNVGGLQESIMKVAGAGHLAGGRTLAQDLSPSPVATDAAPTPEPTTVGPSPSPTVGPPPATESHALAGGVSVIPLPDPWEVTGTNDTGTQAQFADGRGNWIWAGVFTDDPASDAGAIIGENFNNFLPVENYSQLQTGEITAVQPGGSMTSFAVQAYRGLWTDSQGSIELMGNLWVGVRQDGQILVMTIETSPPESFETNIPMFGPLWEGAYNSFAGAG